MVNTVIKMATNFSAPINHAGPKHESDRRRVWIMGLLCHFGGAFRLASEWQRGYRGPAEAGSAKNGRKMMYGRDNAKRSSKFELGGKKSHQNLEL